MLELGGPAKEDAPEDALFDNTLMSFGKQVFPGMPDKTIRQGPVKREYVDLTTIPALRIGLIIRSNKMLNIEVPISFALPSRAWCHVLDFSYALSLASLCLILHRSRTVLPWLSAHQALAVRRVSSKGNWR